MQKEYDNIFIYTGDAAQYDDAIQEKVENDMPDKTQEILRQVNEYLQQERNNLNDTKRDN